MNAHGDTSDRPPLDTLCGEAVMDYTEKEPIQYDISKPMGQRVVSGEWIAEGPMKTRSTRNRTSGRPIACKSSMIFASLKT